jgi:hypothetical protein
MIPISEEGRRAIAELDRLTNHLRQPIPRDWRPSAEDLACAAACGVNVLQQWPRFRAHYTRNRICSQEWSDIWRRWCYRHRAGRGTAA